MALTNRQRCLRRLLLNDWMLVEGAGQRFFLIHETLKAIPPGFEWVDYKTVNALYRKGLLRQINSNTWKWRLNRADWM